MLAYSFAVLNEWCWQPFLFFFCKFHRIISQDLIFGIFLNFVIKNLALIPYSWQDIFRFLILAFLINFLSLLLREKLFASILHKGCHINILIDHLQFFSPLCIITEIFLNAKLFFLLFNFQTGHWRFLQHIVQDLISASIWRQNSIILLV